ncbi:MAG TPA: YfiR family protein [bacterium]|nr:YfiR family protein [bacterium]
MPALKPRAGLLLLALILAAAPLRAEIPLEYQVKAAFLFNFAQFVHWPASDFTRPQEPFRIGILGQDPFDGFLDETIKGEAIEGHPLVVERYTDATQAKDCQVLFVSRSEASRMAAILSELRGRNVLTVGDCDGFLKAGGVVRFVLEKNRVRFRVSLEAAKAGNLSISSRVLRLAEIARPGED